MLIRQTLLYMPAQLIGPLFQFVAAVAWTHWLSPGEYGALAYILAAQELAYLICLAWWSQYMLRYIGHFEGPEQRLHFQRSENSVLAVSAALQALVGVATLMASHAGVTPGLLSATIVYVVARSLTSHLSERARSAGAIAAYTISQLIGPVIGFGLALLAVSRIEASAEMALAGFAIAQLAGLLWLWRRLGLGIVMARPGAEIVNASVRFGAPLVLAGVIGWASFNGIRVIVDQFSGPAAVGLVSVGWGLGQRLAAVLAMLLTAAAFPLAVKHLQAGRKDEALRQVSMSGVMLMCLLAPACVGIVMVSHPLVELMIAEPFRAVTYLVLPLAAIAGALRNLRVHTVDQVIILFEQTRYNVIINVVEVIATVGFCIGGLLMWGLPGAAAGCLAGTIVGFVYGYYIAATRFDLALPWSDLARIALATCVMGLAVGALPMGLAGDNLAAQIALKAGVGGLVYIGAMAALFPAMAREGFGKAASALSGVR